MRGKNSGIKLSDLVKRHFDMEMLITRVFEIHGPAISLSMRDSKHKSQILLVCVSSRASDQLKNVAAKSIVNIYIYIYIYIRVYILQAAINQSMYQRRKPKTTKKNKYTYIYIYFCIYIYRRMRRFRRMSPQPRSRSILSAKPIREICYLGDILV